jgi:YfiH family protein
MRAFAGPGTSVATYDARLERVIGVAAGRLVRVRQVHGREVFVAGPEASAARPPADAVVTTDPAAAVAVAVADCVPILIADRGGRAVAAVHAGWRGTAANVVAATLDVLSRLGVTPPDVMAAIGPCIGPCCYQVDRPVREAFPSTATSAAWFTPDGVDHWRLDLRAANADLLRLAGVPAGAVHVMPFCTADHPVECCSYRRDGTGAGRMTAAIAVGARPPS